MKVFIAITIIGDGGITTAVLNRAKLLIESGHECTLLILFFENSMSEKVKKWRAAGRIHPRLNILSPELSLRSQSEGFEEDPDLFDTPEYEQYQKNIFLDEDGAILNASYHQSKKTICQKFFNKCGVCYLEKKVVGNSVSIKLNRNFKTSKTNFPSLRSWYKNWAEGVLALSEGEKVLIIDGPEIAHAMIDIPSTSAIKKIMLVHDNHYASTPFKPGSPLKKRTDYIKRLSELDALVTLTTQQKQDISDEYGFADKIHVIPNFVQYFEKPVVDRQLHRISIFGKLNPGKQINHAIAAFVTVSESFPNAELHIFGDGPLRQKFEAFIAEMGLSKKIFCHAYTLNPYEEMAKSQLVLFTSLNEAFGMVVLESKLCETPVISYDCKYGPRDIIEDGVDGYLVPQDDTVTLVSAIQVFLQNPSLCQDFGRQGRKNAISKFGAPQLSSKWNNLIHFLFP